MADEEVYFWGLFKNILKKKEEKILVCPQCGSENIVQRTLLEPVNVNLAIPSKCKNCGYEGQPKTIYTKTQNKNTK